MKNKILFILIISSLLTTPFVKVSSQEACSKVGYTIVVINGIFTNDDDALDNRDELERDFDKNYNNEPLKVDYVHNESHGEGVIDVLDVIDQGLFNEKSDYDLTEMLNDASSKVVTQKLLLVGHSQGNFYANNFYDKVAGMEGGVPKESIGVYGVASPASRVAGGGKYLTSNTDKVIAGLVGTAKPILKPNTHIVYTTKDDFFGHDFSKVYLRYRGDQIVSDIKDSLSKLKTNDIQSSQSLCLSPVKISFGHILTGFELVLVDKEALKISDDVKSTIKEVKKIAATSYSISQKIAEYTANGLSKIGTTLANASQKIGSDLGSKLAKIAGKNPASAGLASEQSASPSVVEQVASTENNIEVANTQKVIQPYVAPVKEKIITKNIIEENINPSIAQVSVPVRVVISGFSVNNSKENNTSNDGNSGSDNSGSSSDDKDSGTTNEKDSIAPTITLNGIGIMSIYVGGTYTEEGATAKDDVDESVSVTISGGVDTTKVGTNIITYSATDKAGNIGTASRTVNVVIVLKAPDTAAPVVTLVGDSNIKIDLNSTYNDQGATASDLEDGNVAVNISGSVNTKLAGIYTLTYSAIDKAKNTGSVTRTVEVVIPPVYLSLPTAGPTKDTGVDKSSGKKSPDAFYFQVVYTDSSNTAPKNFYLRAKNLATGKYLPDTYLYPASGFTSQAELKDGKFTNGEIYGNYLSIPDEGEYAYSFLAIDKEGKQFTLGYDDSLKINVLPTKIIYVPKSSFGTGNGDGHDWQVWIFNGSNIYNWSDTYVGNYLHEQFTIQTGGIDSWCIACLQRGIFKHDPKEGFEINEYTTSALESNPQSNEDNKIYNVDIQWDSTGYTYTITNDSVVYATSHTNVAGMNNNLWVGWDRSDNNFTTFPSGNWVGDPYFSPGGRQGGGGMVLEPYPVYR